MSRKPVTKKVINSAESCVDDNLRGVVATYPTLRLHPKHRVISVRRQGESKRVAVLGGGGSGHEPFAGGLVGGGMLDGAVAGGVFASPPTGHVLYGIMQLYKYNSGGVIVIIGNYTGDRLNFGKAIEKAKIAGIQVEGLIVGEDVASSHNKTGGRSMCGEVFFYKLCGAMAEKGYDLASIKKIAAEANDSMATLGVCLSACSLPGQPPLFEIADDEMELGAGVHGEAGIKKMKLGTAKENVIMILDQVVAHLKLKSGDRVAVMIDNLGGTSFMEMNIISAETKDYLESKKITVERIFSGHFKTSLEMHGFQICLLHLNRTRGDLWLELLDAPTEARGWVGGAASRRCDEGHGDDETLLHNEGRKAATGPALSTKDQELFRRSLTKAAEELVKQEELLNRLDSGCGDGDCGITIKKFGLANLKQALAVEKSRQAASSSSEAETDKRKITKNKKYRDDSLSPPPSLPMKPIEEELSEIHSDTITTSERNMENQTRHEISKDEDSDMENEIQSGNSTNDGISIIQENEKLVSENNIRTDSITSHQDSSDAKSATGSEASKGKEFDYIVESLIDLKTLVTYTMRKVDAIEKKIGLCNLNEKNKADQDQLCHRLPLNQLKDLEVFEQEIRQSETLKNQLLQYMKYSGGATEKDCVNRCLEKLFTNYLAQFCSWTGRKNNFKLSGMLVMAIIKAAVKENFPNFTDEHFERAVMMWFQHASTRIKRSKS